MGASYSAAMTSGLFSQLFTSSDPNRRALTWVGDGAVQSWSYGQLAEEAGRWAHVLQAHGAKPGERVLVQIEKQPQAVFLYLGCLRCGATYVPLNTAYSEDEIAYFASDASPVMFITDAQLPDLQAQKEQSPSAFEDQPAGSDHPAAMLYSSGTTGRPKGVMLPAQALLRNAQALREVWDLGHTDVLLHALPLFHTHGLFVALNTLLLAGGQIRMLGKFDPQAVEHHLPEATVFMGVPTFYSRLLSHGSLSAGSVTHLRHAISGSAPLTEETFSGFAEQTGHRIIERYGMTEAGIITAVRPGQAKAAGAVGQPLPGVELRIIDPDDAGIGAVEIKSPGLFSGYWNLPEKTAEDFTEDDWFKTGDLGRLDEDGGLTLTGRAKDLIISGGYNVYPKEVERVIDACAGVAECAVVGMPHPDFGEAGLAVIVGDNLDLSALRNELKAALANYKVPKVLVETDALPRNAMGKVQKNVLQAGYAEMWNKALFERN